MGIEQAKNSLMGGGKNSFSPLDRTGTDKETKKANRKKVRAAVKEGRKEGNKEYARTVDKREKLAKQHGIKKPQWAYQTETARQEAAMERRMARANRKYAKKELGASKEQLKAMKKDEKKRGVGKAYGKNSVNQRNQKELSKAWKDQKAARKAAKKNPSKANLDKVKKTTATKRDTNKRSAERHRLTGYGW